MSIAELKKTADRLSARERRWLRAYLFAQERATNPEWQREIAQKRRKFQAGGGQTSARYKARHARTTESDR
jgi:hypothetical protein